MSPERWHEVKWVFQSLMGVPASDRLQYLDLLQPDAGVRADVLELLDAVTQMGEFLEYPPISPGLTMRELTSPSLPGRPAGLRRFIAAYIADRHSEM